MVKNKSLGLIIAGLPLICVTCANPWSEHYNRYKINEYFIADGDTIYAKIGGKKVGIRLLGIDTPETRKGKEHLAPYENHFAQKAKKFVEKILKNDQISITKITSDKYQRWVCRVSTASINDLGIEIIKNGLARVKYLEKERKNLVYWNNNGTVIDYYNSLKKAENEAKINSVGIWKYSEKDVFHKK
ncbi:thermonuclease family protein [Mycoplasma simbae]|uniref:thermonuclease family protein n=1 Tax=Mycoplasma simbae TaxID=36744 RepID=UPI0004983DBE|nr:thermonuclease family protein [Mycoplasma simbae]